MNQVFLGILGVTVQELRDLKVDTQEMSLAMMILMDLDLVLDLVLDMDLDLVLDQGSATFRHFLQQAKVS